MDADLDEFARLLPYAARFGASEGAAALLGQALALCDKPYANVGAPVVATHRRDRRLFGRPSDSRPRGRERRGARTGRRRARSRRRRRRARLGRFVARAAAGQAGLAGEAGGGARAARAAAGRARLFRAGRRDVGAGPRSPRRRPGVRGGEPIDGSPGARARAPRALRGVRARRSGRGARPPRGDRRPALPTRPRGSLGRARGGARAAGRSHRGGERVLRGGGPRAGVHRAMERARAGRDRCAPPRSARARAPGDRRARAWGDAHRSDSKARTDAGGGGRRSPSRAGLARSMGSGPAR